MKITSLALALMLHSVFSMLNPVSAAAAETLVVAPEITDEALVNPGMGWVYYHYSNRLWAYGSRTAPGDTLDWFPGVSTIYLRVLWSDLEPEEGVYRWDIFDSMAQPWIDKGKTDRDPHHLLQPDGERFAGLGTRGRCEGYLVPVQEARRSRGFPAPVGTRV